LIENPESAAVLATLATLVAHKIVDLIVMMAIPVDSAISWTTGTLVQAASLRFAF
jgi:hypothetical protein